MSSKITLYALSTCGWCKKTKKFLEDHGVQYECFDVDLLEQPQKDQVREELARHNPRRSYPTMVVDDKEVIVGFDEDRIREILQI